MRALDTSVLTLQRRLWYRLKDTILKILNIVYSIYIILYISIYREVLVFGIIPSSLVCMIYTYFYVFER
jgi:hypothetical protein